MSHLRPLFIPRGKTVFQPVQYPSIDDESDSEEYAITPWQKLGIDEEFESSIKKCEKSLKQARAAAGLHYENPDMTTELRLPGLNRGNPNLFLEISLELYTEGPKTSTITLNVEKKTILKLQFKTLSSPEERQLDDGDQPTGREVKYTLQVSKPGGKTISVPEDALLLSPFHHYCVRIHKSSKATKIYVNCNEVARVEEPLSELSKPFDLVTENITVKSVHMPTQNTPVNISKPFKGDMKPGDKIIVFGEQRPGGDEENKKLLTLGDVVVPHDKDNKSGKTRITVQRFHNCLVVYNNGKVVFVCRQLEGLNTNADLSIETFLMPTGIWISRM